MPKRTPVKAIPPVPTRRIELDGKTIKQIDRVIRDVRAQHGEDAIFRFSEFAEEKPMVRHTTGIPALDAIIGGGLPQSKLITINGPESVGKSALCKKLIATAQRAGFICHFLDAEMSEDSVPRARAMGVDVDSLLWSEVFFIEEAFGILGTLVETARRSPTPVYAFFDSVAASEAQRKKKGEDDDGEDLKYGYSGSPDKAIFLSENLKKLLHQIADTPITLVFVNQERERTRVFGFQKPTYNPGGRALKHFSHLSLDLHRVQTLKRGADAIGIRSKVTVVKSKVCIPFRSCELDIMFDGRIGGTDD